MPATAILEDWRASSSNTGSSRTNVAARRIVFRRRRRKTKEAALPQLCAMAFMMPVVKQDYDIYSRPNSRKNSVCSTSPGTSKSRNSSRNNSISYSSSPTQTVITPEQARKIIQRRRSRGMSECLPDLREIDHEEPRQRRKSSLGKLSWSSLQAALQKLKPAEPKSKSQTSIEEQES